MLTKKDLLKTNQIEFATLEELVPKENLLMQDNTYTAPFCY